MHKIDAPGATETNTFTEGDPNVPTAPTTVGAKWLNAVQGELVALVEGLGGTLNDQNHGQIWPLLSTALGMLLSKAGGTLTGFLTLHANPTNALHAAPKQYVDSAVAGVDLSGKVSKTGDTMSGALAMGSNKVTGLANGTASGDAVNKGQMDTADALKANLANPTFTGTPAAPTAAATTNTTQIATTAHVKLAVPVAIADIGVDAVGSRTLLRRATGSTDPGQTRPGSDLVYSTVSGEDFGTGSPSGTWKAMGPTRATNVQTQTTSWLRIA